MISLRIEKNHFYKKILKQEHVKQIPFLISKSMNETALLTRIELGRKIESDLVVRNKGMRRVMFNRSTKSNHEVTMFHPFEELKKQEEGGVVRGKIAYPMEIRRHFRQKITNKKRPKSLKGKDGIFYIFDSRNKKTNTSGGNRKNSIRGRSMRDSLGGLKPWPGIYRRNKKKVKRLYLFTRTAKYDPRKLDFTWHGQKYYSRRFPKIFRQNIQRYIGLDNF